MGAVASYRERNWQEQRTEEESGTDLGRGKNGQLDVKQAGYELVESLGHDGFQEKIIDAFEFTHREGRDHQNRKRGLVTFET